jgi:hypothetical protein
VQWLVGTVAETVPETADAVTVRLAVPSWPGHGLASTSTGGLPSSCY